MAGKDALGVLSGLQKVVSAFCSEAGPELQQVVNSQALRSLAESLWQCTCGGEGQQWAGRGKWDDESGVMEFPDWDSFDKADPFAKFAGLPENFPPVNSASTAYPYTVGFGGGTATPISNATPTSSNSTSASPFHRPPLTPGGPSFPDAPFGRRGPNRSYHTPGWFRRPSLSWRSPRGRVGSNCGPDPLTSCLHSSPLKRSDDSIVGSGAPQTAQEHLKTNADSSSSKTHTEV